MHKLSSFISGLFLGGLAGLALGMLAAPKPGSQLMHELADASEDLYRRAAFEIEDLKEKVEDIRARAIELRQAGVNAVESASRYVASVVESFDPEPQIMIVQAQETLGEADKTQQQTDEILRRAKNPHLQTAMSNGERDLNQQAAQELAQNFSTRINLERQA